MKYLLSKIWSKLLPSSSESVWQSKIKLKRQPYNNTFFFTHVPKTGGTSFIVFLDRFFPSKVIFPHQLWHEIGEIAEYDKHSYRLIRGHYGGCTADLFTDNAISFLTILREPVKLAYSTYEYVRREKNTALHDLVLSENMDFETFLSHKKTRHLVSNRMVHNLAFGYKYDETVKKMDINATTFSEFRKKINKNQCALNDESRLEMANSFIDRCLWFGILEKYDDAVRLLCYKMAWPPQGASQRLNVNKIKPVISDEARAKALSMNILDSSLYKMAQTKFLAEFKQMKMVLAIDDNEDAVGLDKAIDQHYQENYVSKYKCELTDSVDYNCSEILLGGQWHRREWNSLGKTYFRWSGPGNTSFLDFWLQKKSYIIVIEVVDAIKSSLLDTLKIDVNGINKSVAHNGRGKSRQLTVMCDASDILNNGLLRISFHSEALQSHRIFFSSGDNRVVGFALSTVKILKQ